MRLECSGDGGEFTSVRDVICKKSQQGENDVVGIVGDGTVVILWVPAIPIFSKTLLIRMTLQCMDNPSTVNIS